MTLKLIAIAKETYDLIVRDNAPFHNEQYSVTAISTTCQNGFATNARTHTYVTKENQEILSL